METFYTTGTIEQIYSHGSIRKYKSDPVPREMVETIVSAGQRSSTSSNLQSYSVVAVTDTDTRAQLAQLCGDQDHIRQAPVFLAWCADYNRLEQICRLRGYEVESRFVESFLVSTVDAAITMQTATIAAESLGLGMCYIGAIRNNPSEIIKLLKLPRLVFPISGMTLGWPAVDARFRPRLPLSEVLHWESYKSQGRHEALAQYDETMMATGIYHGRQVEQPGSDGEFEEYGWLEHSARRVSRPKRVRLRQYINKQGFNLE